MTSLRPPVGDDSHPELLSIVRDEIEKHGAISFARFMDFTVAHPEFGYYATSRDRAGVSGDFLTAPETHPIFGRIVARQLLEMWEAIGAPEEFAIREFGAGRGTLARQVLAAISASEREGLSTVRYLLIDLGEEGPDARDVSQPGSFHGVILGNEFLDALPFHRLVFADGEFREIYTVIRGGWFADEIGPLSSGARAHLPLDLKPLEGQRIEVSPRRVMWLRTVARSLGRGFVMLLDYGYPRPEIHNARRFPNGTLKTYRSHEIGDEPYLHIGRQDITAHVDFTAMELAARDAGLEILGLTTQAEFVSGLGIDRDLIEIQRDAESSDEYLAARAAVLALLDPAGLGRFRVLLLSKGIECGPLLAGLTFKLPGAGL